MKILIFGANGMLGRYLTFVLRKKHNVVPITRNEFDVFKNFQNMSRSLDKLISDNNPQYVINCCGIINKRTVSSSEMYIVNSYFPQILSKICGKMKIKLIHPSTDCVFSGEKGKYQPDDDYDPYDDYGISKSLAENINACIIRVSIIGEENNSRSLVEWAKSSHDTVVNGYTNHLWNGITCLEYAKLVEKMIQNNIYWYGIKNFSSTYNGKSFITKYDLLKEISDIYKLNLTIKEYETEKKCDRTLIPSEFNYLIETDIVKQIKEMQKQV